MLLFKRQCKTDHNLSVINVDYLTSQNIQNLGNRFFSYFKGLFDTKFVQFWLTKKKLYYFLVL